MGEPCRYRTYVSQNGYSGGETMCTSVSYLLACGVLGEYSLELPPTRKQMDTIMQVSSILHRKLIADHHQQHHLFACMDVVKLTGTPKNIVLREVLGCTLQLPDGFIRGYQDEDDNACSIIDLPSLVDTMVRKSSIVITVNDHSTMLHRSGSGEYWYFDPMVAYMMCTGDRERTQNFIKGCLGAISREYTGVYIKPDPRGGGPNS